MSEKRAALKHAAPGGTLFAGEGEFRIESVTPNRVLITNPNGGTTSVSRAFLESINATVTLPDMPPHGIGAVIQSRGRYLVRIRADDAGGLQWADTGFIGDASTERIAAAGFTVVSHGAPFTDVMTLMNEPGRLEPSTPEAQEGSETKPVMFSNIRPSEQEVKIDALLHQTITDICCMEPLSDEVEFTLADGRTIRMFHEQDCCEEVRLTDVAGDPADLVGSPVLQAEEVTSSGDAQYGTFTWTFYKLATAKGYVTLRWYGSSNGYYSEAVSLAEQRPAPKAN